MSTDKGSSATGTDNRPPMLVESDYESWKICIERYIRGKPLGKLIWRSIQNGPTPYPQITVTEGQGDAAVQVTRDKTDGEFTEIENNIELADIQATNILSSGKSLQQKKEELFDEYERFRAIGNESIHDYFVCFHKLINDIKITQLDILAHQMNTNFVNNLPPYWEKYVTNVKNNKDISSSSIVDHLAYLASTTHHLTPTKPTIPLPSTSSLTLPLQPAAQSSNDAMLETMSQIVNLLSGFRKQFPPIYNQLRTSSNSRSTEGTQSYGQVTDNKVKLLICYNCRGQGHVSRQCKEKKSVKDSQYFKDKILLMEAKVKGAVLNVEVKAFLADVECTAPYDQPLAITTTNIFEVSHEDAYDSDIDEGPHATAAFMANLSFASGTNGATISHVNEEQSMVNDSLRAELARSLCSSNLWYAKQAKIAQPTLYDGHALLKPTNTPVRVHDSKESLVQAEVSRTKMSNRLGTIKPINYDELNALYSHFVPQKELS
uniref:CCHC-type domain-containing protein n=1 Tax=Tanacetum cinerariifolium TaxID=118510 RepID=A0A699I5R6_TANCI|nr:hypothetical protein [Tanacetum cinerariifolium]